MCPKHMLLLTYIKLDHEKVLFSESSVSGIYFELASIKKKWEFNFRGFTDYFDSK